MTFEKSNNEVKSEITEFLKSFGSYNQGLWHNIKYLRDLPLKKQNEKRERNLNKPVAVFLAPIDYGMEKGLNVILSFNPLDAHGLNPMRAAVPCAGILMTKPLSQ